MSESFNVLLGLLPGQSAPSPRKPAPLLPLGGQTVTTTAPLPLMAVESESVAPTGLPQHLLFTGDSEFILLVYKTSKTDIKCKFLPNNIQIHFTRKAPTPAKVIRKLALLAGASFTAEFHEQQLHREQKYFYVVPLPHPIETAHIHIKKAVGNGMLMYRVPFESNQAEML